MKKILEKIDALKKNGKKIGLCVGSFDLLHPGHLKHFESAKKMCDVLVVAATCDKFVKAKKGDSRPIFNEKQRVYFLNQIKSVDFAIINRFDPAVELIELIKPNVYIKGPDYIKNKDWRLLAEEAAVKKIRGEFKFTDDPSLSTTEIISFLKNVDASDG